MFALKHLLKFFNGRTCYFQVVAKGLSSEEVKIKTPWGQIAVKTWGDKKLPLVLCLHGFADNAATFDRLIPLLPETFHYAAIDLPGHGWSSHIEPGFIYSDPFYVECCERTRRYFGDSQVGLIGHSMGSAVLLFYHMMYSPRATFHIGLDLICYPENPMLPRLVHLGRRIDKAISQERLLGREQLRPKDELINGMIRAWRGSVGKEEAEILLSRGVEQVGELFKLTRDLRTQNNQIFGVPCVEEHSNMGDLKMCIISATDGPRFMKNDIGKKLVEMFAKRYSYVENHLIPGSHHVHLRHPERVAPIISKFLRSI